MSQLKNKNMKHLLSNTEEGVENTSRRTKDFVEMAILAGAESLTYDVHGPIRAYENVTYNEMREATRHELSITEDMRRQSTQRMLEEVQSQIRNATNQYMGVRRNDLGLYTHSIEWSVMKIIEGYKEMGSVRDARVTSFYRNEDEKAIVDVSMQLASNGEWVRMRLTFGE